MYTDPKLLLIGMGNIGRYIAPCYYGVTGQQAAANILAVKSSPRDLDQLRQRFPFPIRGDGDAAAALEQMEPDVILLAVPPHQIPQLVQEQLKPYYQRCAAGGRKPPVIYSYAPAPAVTWFRDLLGPQVLAANIIPNMVDYAHGIYLASITHNMVTLDQRADWPQEDKEFLERFLAPQGLYLNCPADTVHAVLAAKITSHRIYELCLGMSRAFTAAGQPVSHQQLAETGRAYLRSRFDSFEPDIWHCSPAATPARLRPFVDQVLRGWYDGVWQQCFELGVDSYANGRFNRGMFQLHLLTVQVEDEATLEQNTRNHSTPGGMQEDSLRAYEQLAAADLYQAAQDWVNQRPDPSFAARWQGYAAALVARTTELGQKVDKKK